MNVQVFFSLSFNFLLMDNNFLNSQREQNSYVKLKKVKVGGVTTDFNIFFVSTGLYGSASRSIYAAASMSSLAECFYVFIYVITYIYYMGLSLQMIKSTFILVKGEYDMLNCTRVFKYVCYFCRITALEKQFTAYCTE